MKKFIVIVIFCIIFILPFKNHGFPNNTTPYYVSASDELITLTEALERENPKFSEDIRIMTYNLLSDSIGFDGTYAQERADGVCRIINKLNPDVIGLQEASRNWRNCIRDNTKYHFIHPILSDIQDSMTCIIYNPDTITLLKSGEYVFNYAKDFRTRKMVWGIFTQNVTGKIFIVANTHFSLSNNNNDTSMNQSEELLNFCESLKSLYNCPVYFTGDFNARERNQKCKLSSPVYENLITKLEDTKSVSKRISHGKNQSAYASSNDHIFLTGNALIKKYVILSQEALTLLSDHYPIFIDTVI